MGAGRVERVAGVGRKDVDAAARGSAGLQDAPAVAGAATTPTATTNATSKTTRARFIAPTFPTEESGA
jgi:hypothetical protein